MEINMFMLTIQMNLVALPKTSTPYPVTVNDLPEPTINGSNSVCNGTSVVYTTESGMSSYAWTINRVVQLLPELARLLFW